MQYERQKKKPQRAKCKIFEWLWHLTLNTNTTELSKGKLWIASRDRSLAWRMFTLTSYKFQFASTSKSRLQKQKTNEKTSTNKEIVIAPDFRHCFKTNIDLLNHTPLALVFININDFSRSHSLQLHWIFPEYRFEHGFGCCFLFVGRFYGLQEIRFFFSFLSVRPIKINLKYKQIKNEQKKTSWIRLWIITKWISVKSRTQKAQLSLTHRAFYTQQQYDEWNDNDNGVKKK